MKKDNFLRICTSCLEKNFAFQYPVSELHIYNNFHKTTRKTIAYRFLNKVITHLGILNQFLYPVQKFRLKIDTLKNGTSRMGVKGRGVGGDFHLMKNESLSLKWAKMVSTLLQNKRGRWFRAPPSTVHLRTDDVTQTHNTSF